MSQTVPPTPLDPHVPHGETPATETRATPDSPTIGLDALAEAHTRTVDALAGCKTMVDKAEPEFRPLAERFRDLHTSHATQLSNILVARGRSADAEGSFMGTINQAVVTARSWFDDIDDDILDQVRKGEERVLAGFDEALGRLDDEEVDAALRTMRNELDSLLREAAHRD